MRVRWLMLQARPAGRLVIATGVQYSVRQFAEKPLCRARHATALGRRRREQVSYWNARPISSNRPRYFRLQK